MLSCSFSARPSGRTYSANLILLLIQLAEDKGPERRFRTTTGYGQVLESTERFTYLVATSTVVDVPARNAPVH